MYYKTRLFTPNYVIFVTLHSKFVILILLTKKYNNNVRNVTIKDFYNNYAIQNKIN